MENNYFCYNGENSLSLYSFFLFQRFLLKKNTKTFLFQEQEKQLDCDPRRDLQDDNGLKTKTNEERIKHVWDKAPPTLQKSNNEITTINSPPQ